MPLSVSKQQAEQTFYVYAKYTKLKAVLNNRTLFFFFWGRKVEIKYKSLLKLISVYSENNYFSNIFIFWLVFHSVCMGTESTHFNLTRGKLYIIIL